MKFSEVQWFRGPNHEIEIADEKNCGTIERAACKRVHERRNASNQTVSVMNQIDVLKLEVRVKKCL